MSDLASFILETVLFAPFSVPYWALEPGPGPPCGWSFAAPPFGGLSKSYLERAHCVDPTPPERSDIAPRRSPESRAIAAQIGVESLASLDGTYGRIQGLARLLTVYRVEFDAAYSQYAGWGRASPGGLGQAHVDIRFAQSERAQFRAGAGVRSHFVGGGASVGFDGLYAVDVFWPGHGVTTLELSGGSLGVNGWAAEVRPTAGYVIGPIEVYVGWDGVWLGVPRQQAEFLGGPILGVRAYFWAVDCAVAISPRDCRGCPRGGPVYP